MKYKCLVVDHDDTAVKSSLELHYPAFQLIMKAVRPDIPEYSFSEFLNLCFDESFTEQCRKLFHFTEEEIDAEYLMWKEYIKDKIPSFYEGFVDILREFRRRGGYVCVVSLSEKDDILNHYATQDFIPDDVYGWELPENLRKPNTYPLEQIMQKFNLKPEEIIMLDDMRLGGDMAKAVGVDFATAAWGLDLNEDLEAQMRQLSDFYFNTVEEFGDFILAD